MSYGGLSASESGASILSGGQSWNSGGKTAKAPAGQSGDLSSLTGLDSLRLESTALPWPPNSAASELGKTLGSAQGGTIGAPTLPGIADGAPLADGADRHTDGNSRGGASLPDERLALADLRDGIADQLSGLFGFMNQVVNRERVRHASNVSMMMRRVDKDLKSTYESMKEMLGNLTKQMAMLVREVETSREQVRAIQQKYTTARQSVETQAQYVLELEAVLDGQCEGVSSAMKQLNEQSVGKSQAMAKNAEENRRRELKLRAENERLRAELRRAKDAADLLSSEGRPPLLPEMSASWTRRSPPTPPEGDPSGAASGGGRGWSQGVDIVGSVLAHCDSGRGVPRSKPARATPRGGRGPSSQGPSRHQDYTREAVAALRRRAEKAEERCDRLHHLLGFSASSMGLLRDVVGELRASGHLAGADAAADGEWALPKLGRGPSAAEEALGRIARLFHAHAPKLQGLPEVLAALAREAAERRPQAGAATNRGPPTTGRAGDSPTAALGAQRTRPWTSGPGLVASPAATSTAAMSLAEEPSVDSLGGLGTSLWSVGSSMFSD